MKDSVSVEKIYYFADIFGPKTRHARLNTFMTNAWLITEWSVARSMKVMVFYLIDWDNPSRQSANSSEASLFPTQIL
jgi:hypothetical protein